MPKRRMTSCRSGAVAQRTQRTGTAAAWHTGHNVLPCTTVALCHTVDTADCRTQAHFGANRDWSKRVHAYDAFGYGDVGVCANRRGCTRHARGAHAARTRHARRTTYIVLSRDSAECTSRTAHTCRTNAAPSWVHVSKNRRACTRCLLCRIRLGRRSMCACLRIILRIVHTGYCEHWQLHA